jgi:hypothetical protein
MYILTLERAGAAAAAPSLLAHTTHDNAACEQKRKEKKKEKKDSLDPLYDDARQLAPVSVAPVSGATYRELDLSGAYDYERQLAGISGAVQGPQRQALDLALMQEDMQQREGRGEGGPGGAALKSSALQQSQALLETREAFLPAHMPEDTQQREASEENAFPLALKQEDIQLRDGRPADQYPPDVAQRNTGLRQGHPPTDAADQYPADVGQRDTGLRQRHSPTDAVDQPTDAADEESADVAPRVLTFEQRALVIGAQGRSVYTDTYPDTYPDASPDTYRSLNLSHLKAELSRAGVELQAVLQHTYADVC